jgi:ribosome biogenesis GTPase A
MLRLLRYRRPLVVETAGSIRHFETPNRTKLWYPKHMTIQLKVMEAKLKSVELIIEVHDARVPITGRNPQFLHSLYAIRPHILVFNKVDLIDIDRYR